MFRLPRGSLQTSTPFGVHPKTSVTFGFPVVAFYPEEILGSKPHFTILRLLFPRGLYHSEVFPDLKVPTPDLKVQQQIVHDLRRYLCNAFLPMFITCNGSINAGSYGQWQISPHAISPTIANDHTCYNKFNTCRSYSCNGLSIPPPHRHPCQVFMILLLPRGRDRFPNP